ncbi:matrixin family metalloprotease [Octopus vulgaris]|uniref:Matrixin family metalloprotease n=1 Tax=Octopus vulgaris TaxID=6645 RepID=A0AA36BH44_OCTVU|nr:matrixin family metalloprotease [Octopus vulgaris]
MYSAEGVNFKRFDVAKVIETSGNDNTDDEFDGIVVNQKLAWGQKDDGQNYRDKLSNYRNSKKFENGEYNVEKKQLVEVETENHRSKRDVGKMAVEEGKELTDKKIEENRKASNGKNVKDKKRGNEREENEKAEDVNENGGLRENKKNYVDSKFGDQGNMMDGDIDQDGMTETHGQNIKHQVPELTDATANNVPHVNAYHFLMQFGYIDNSPYSPLSLTNPTTEALKKFQEFANLNVTGEFNTETIKQMSSPRCGVPDMFNGKTVFNFQINRSEIILRYGTRVGSPILATSKRVMRMCIYKATIKEAFDTWETASVLRFHEITNGNADIVISFNYGQHGDSWPFDGAGTPKSTTTVKTTKMTTTSPTTPPTTRATTRATTRPTTPPQTTSVKETARKRCYRLTGGVRDKKFPKILPEFIRSAVVIDDVLLAFSANTVYHLDNDCEILDASDIGTEFPEIGRNVMSAYTVDDKNIVFLKKRSLTLIMKWNREQLGSKFNLNDEHFCDLAHESMNHDLRSKLTCKQLQNSQHCATDYFMFDN